ncbi:MAG: VOC family protein [Parafilimonas sp.]|nr:VOC family protein [Parafilimonas sp.]
MFHLVPYLHFNGEAEEVLNFYKDVFDGEILVISRYGDSPMQANEDWKNKIIHSRLKFGDNLIMISDSHNGQLANKEGNIQLSVEVDDKKKIEEVFNKLAESGKVTMPLAKQFWGATFGMLQDKFGVNWMFNHEEKTQK